MNRVTKFFVKYTVLAIALTLRAVGFGLRQIIKLVGLDPDVSPYERHLACLKFALEAQHEMAYETDFDLNKYVKKPTMVRPSFKLKGNREPLWTTLKVTPPESSAQLKDDVKKLQLKELVSKIKKSAEEAPKKTIRTRPKAKKIVKKSIKKVA